MLAILSTLKFFVALLITNLIEILTQELLPENVFLVFFFSFSQFGLVVTPDAKVGATAGAWILSNQILIQINIYIR